MQWMKTSNCVTSAVKTSSLYIHWYSAGDSRLQELQGSKHTNSSECSKRFLESDSRSSSSFTEPEGSLSYSQEPTSGPYHVTNYFSPHTPSTITLRSILILSSHLRLDLPSGLLPSDLPIKTLYAFRVTHKRVTCSASEHTEPKGGVPGLN
jgi:hypothetical protein